MVSDEVPQYALQSVTERGVMTYIQAAKTETGVEFEQVSGLRYSLLLDPKSAAFFYVPENYVPDVRL